MTSAHELCAALARRELSARELSERCLRRIDAVDPEIGAVVACEPELVLAAADEADARLAAGERASLLGLPVTVKDSLDVEGMATTVGSYANEGRIAPRDATAVARLRDAGAVILAKTNLPELSSSYETDNAIHGRTSNPLDLARTPGGSSGGEAAIIAAGASPAGLGADGGGSIRVPAHFCGIAGLRPTIGRVPETGHRPRSRGGGMLDLVCVGPMARSVGDLGPLLAAIAGPDDVDPYAPPVPLAEPERVEVGSLSVGWYAEDGVALPTACTASTVERAADALAGLGCDVEEVRPPGVEDATELFFEAAGTDARRLRRLARGAGGRHHPQFAAFLETAPTREPSAEDWFDVNRRIIDFRARTRAFLGRHDAFLCPVAAGPAPLHGSPPGRHDPADYLAYEGFNYAHTWSLAGAPALSVPAGVEDGLPIGIQVVARAWREDVVLALGGALEEALGGFGAFAEDRIASELGGLEARA